jgi:hypothetical protein
MAVWSVEVLRQVYKSVAEYLPAAELPRNPLDVCGQEADLEEKDSVGDYLATIAVSAHPPATRRRYLKGARGCFLSDLAFCLKARTWTSPEYVVSQSSIRSAQLCLYYKRVVWGGLS